MERIEIDDLPVEQDLCDQEQKEQSGGMNDFHLPVNSLVGAPVDYYWPSKLTDPLALSLK